jgi:hypothetical protein
MEEAQVSPAFSVEGQTKVGVPHGITQSAIKPQTING